MTGTSQGYQDAAKWSRPLRIIRVPQRNHQEDPWQQPEKVSPLKTIIPPQNNSWETHSIDLSTSIDHPSIHPSCIIIISSRGIIHHSFIIRIHHSLVFVSIIHSYPSIIRIHHSFLCIHTLPIFSQIFVILSFFFGFSYFSLSCSRAARVRWCDLMIGCDVMGFSFSCCVCRRRWRWAFAGPCHYH